MASEATLGQWKCICDTSPEERGRRYDTPKCTLCVMGVRGESGDTGVRRMRSAYAAVAADQGIERKTPRVPEVKPEKPNEWECVDCYILFGKLTLAPSRSRRRNTPPTCPNCFEPMTRIEPYEML